MADVGHQRFTKSVFYTPPLTSVGAKLRYMGYFASLLHPQEEKVGHYL